MLLYLLEQDYQDLPDLWIGKVFSNHLHRILNLILTKNMICCRLPSTNGYIYVVTWEDFKKYPNADISQAFDYRDQTPSYKIKKSL